MAHRYRSHAERHEKLGRFYGDGETVPKCWTAGWEFTLPTDVLTRVQQVTGITAEDPSKINRLCVLSGYTKEHREKVMEFARKPPRINVLRRVYIGTNFVIGEFYNGQLQMFSVIINNTNGQPTDNPVTTARFLPSVLVTGCEVTMKTYTTRGTPP
jgi:hypothetical protein